MLDYDRRRVPRVGPIYAVCRIAGLRPVWIETRRTRRGWHVRVYFRDALTPAELVAFQAACGSDPRREALNLMRVLAMRRRENVGEFWSARWNLLYEKKIPARASER
jgi:hypothetical protein